MAKTTYLQVLVRPGDRERLWEVARRVGALAPSGLRAHEPSVSRLLQGIATGELIVTRRQEATHVDQQQ